MKVLQIKYFEIKIERNITDIKLNSLNLFLSEINKEDIYKVEKFKTPNYNSYVSIIVWYYIELEKCPFCGSNLVEQECPNKCNEIKKIEDIEVKIE